MMHRVSSHFSIVAGVILGVFALTAICPPAALAQVKADETVRRLKPAAGPGGDAVGGRAAAGQPDQYRRRLARAGLGRRGAQLSPHARRQQAVSPHRGGRQDQDPRRHRRRRQGRQGRPSSPTGSSPSPWASPSRNITTRPASTQGCRVFVGNSPDLLVLEDTDGDDKADKRYPLLTGFGGIDSDHGVHGMVLGPRRQALFHPRRRLLLGPARPLRAAAELRRRRQERPARLDRSTGQHPAGQPRRHAVRDHLRPPAQQL